MNTPEQHTIITIAKACHAANMAVCLSFGDKSQVGWYLAEQWQRDSAIAGVEFARDNPTAGSSAQHDAWSADKRAAGWVYGEIKNAEAKTHPCLVPFEQLPPHQQAKDAVFQAVARSLIASLVPRATAPATS